MKISSVHAAVVKDPTMLGRTGTPTASTELRFMNPLASSSSHRGRVSTFSPPWGEAICVVMFDTGDWGVGLTAHAAAVVPMVNDYLGPMIAGETVATVDDIVELWDVMGTASTANIGVSGVVSYAISAIDLALYDGLGKRLEAPVFELLGGQARRELHCISAPRPALRIPAGRRPAWPFRSTACWCQARLRGSVSNSPSTQSKLAHNRRQTTKLESPRLAEPCRTLRDATGC